MSEWIKKRIVVFALGAALAALATYTATKTREGYISQRQAEIANVAASNAVEWLLNNWPAGK